jgi:hypothetical protein
MVYVTIPPRAYNRLWGYPRARLHRLARVLPLRGRRWEITADPGEELPEGLFEALRELGYRPRKGR